MSRTDGVAREQHPLVSICLPVYNAEKTITQTLCSILGQTYRNTEILVFDNASTDNTPSLLGEFSDPRLKIYRNEVNIGAERNFSRAVQSASGEYIALFHADDLYLPEMVEKQVAAFQKDPAVGAVFTLANFINSRGEIIGESNLPLELMSKESYFFREIFEAILGSLNFLVCPSAMVRSELYKELMPFNVEKFRTSADLDMWLRILATHPIVILQEKLMSYRFSIEQGSYQFACLRTERADYFEVMDYYLSRQAESNFSAKALVKYELAKNIDRVRCAKNYLLKSQSSEAKRLLIETFSANMFWGFGGAGGGVGAQKVLVYWLFAAISVALFKFGLGQCLARSLQRLLPKRGVL
ncbi:MAG: glycosyltransferase [Firmicutes bacterium]|nr:glycosyltransferase [Bacillota bacterium]MCL5993924.1 glycosyltransferase [Bacillota bacterium]